MPSMKKKEKKNARLSWMMLDSFIFKFILFNFFIFFLFSSNSSFKNSKSLKLSIDPTFWKMNPMKMKRNERIWHEESGWPWVDHSWQSRKANGRQTDPRWIQLISQSPTRFWLITIYFFFFLKFLYFQNYIYFSF